MDNTRTGGSPLRLNDNSSRAPTHYTPTPTNEDAVQVYTMESETGYVELDRIVQKMTDAGESEANIAAVIKQYASSKASNGSFQTDEDGMHQTGTSGTRYAVEEMDENLQTKSQKDAGFDSWGDWAEASISATGRGLKDYGVKGKNILEKAWIGTKNVGLSTMIGTVDALGGQFGIGRDGMDFLLGEKSNSVLTDTETGEEIPMYLPELAKEDRGGWETFNPRYQEIMGDDNMKFLPKFADDGGAMRERYKKLYTEGEFKGLELGAATNSFMGDKYDAIERNNLEIGDTGSGIVGGFKEGDPGDVLLGAVDGLVSVVTTMVPAVLTRGVSLLPQVVAPMYTDYNMAKAEAIYGEDDPEAIDKLIQNDETEIAIPATLGLLAVALEKVGIRGIGKYVAAKSFTGKGAAQLVMTGGKEGLTEWLQGGVEQVNTGIAKGDDEEKILEDTWEWMKSDDALESFAQGFVGGGGVAAGGRIIRRAVKDDTQGLRTNEFINALGELQQRRLATNSPEVKKSLDKKIKEVEQNFKIYINENNGLAEYLTEDQSKELVDILGEKTSIRNDISKLEKQKRKNNISEEDFDLAKGDAVLELEKLQTKANQIKRDANRKLLQENLKTSDQAISKVKGLTQTSFDTTQKFLDEVNRRLKGKGKPSISDASNIDGLIFDNEILINEEVAAETNAISVGSHELLHGIMKSTLNGKQRVVGKDVNGKDVTSDLTEEGSKLIKSFIETLSSKELSAVQTRVDNNYRYNRDKDGKIISEKEFEEYAEEYLNSYADAAVKGEFSDGMLRKAGNFIANIFKGKGYDKIKFESGEDVKSFLKDYVKDVKKGEIGKKFTDLASEGIEVDTSDLKLSMTSDQKKTAAKNVKELGAKNTNKSWRKGGADAAIKEMKDQKYFDGLIASKYKVKPVPRDFVEKVYSEMTAHIKRFKPEQNDDLFAYINSQITNKAGSVYNREYKVDEAMKGSRDIDAKTAEGTPVIQIAAETESGMEAFEDQDMSMAAQSRRAKLAEQGKSESDQYSAFRNELGLDEAMMDKIRKAVVKTFGTKLPNINSKKFRAALEKAYRTELKKPIQDMMGKGDAYNEFLDKTFPIVYRFLTKESLVQMERLVGGKKDKENGYTNAQRIFTTQRRVTKSAEVDKLIEEGKLPKDTSRVSGPNLIEKLPYPGKEKILAYFRGVNSLELLGYEREPSDFGTRKDRVAEQMGVELGFDATMETVQDPEVAARREGILELTGQVQAENDISVMGKQIDRDPGVKFSKSSLFEAQAMSLVKDVVNNGFETVFTEDGKLVEGYPAFGYNQKAIDFAYNLWDDGTLNDGKSIGFKAKVFLSDKFPQEVKDAFKEDGALKNNDDALDRLYDAVSVLTTELGPGVMDAIGFEIAGFKNRVMDAPKLKKDGTPGRFYERLQKLSKKVRDSVGVVLPFGLDLKAVSIMNKNAGVNSIFGKVQKILDMPIKAKGEGGKLEMLAKLQPEIDAASAANIKLAKHISAVLIKGVRDGSIDQVSALHLLQAQTGIVNGFRGLSGLGLITVLDGSQKPGENHPHYKKYFKELSKTMPKDKARIEAIKLTGYKGEHLAPNSNTMFEIAELFNEKLTDAELNNRLDDIFRGHSQMHTTIGLTKTMDKELGATNDTDFNRVKALDQVDIDATVRADGTPYPIVLAEVEILKEVSKMNSAVDQRNESTKVMDQAIKASRSSTKKLIDGLAENDISDAVSGINPDEYSNIRFSKSHRAEYEKRLLKNNADIGTTKQAAAHIDALFNWVDSSEVPVKKKSKFEKLALHYMVNNKLRMPEDGYKVVEAERLAEAKKIDPFSFKNPNEIIERYAGEVDGKKVINPDDVKEFTNKRELANGITIYNVDNSSSTTTVPGRFYKVSPGQQAVRDQVDQHFGKKSNPWCIVQSADGKLTEQAGEYWDQYGDKQILFKDGKLLAMRTESREDGFSDEGDVEFWSRDNVKYNEVPGNDYVDEQGREIRSSFNEKTGKDSGIIYGATKGSIESGKIEIYDTWRGDDWLELWRQRHAVVGTSAEARWKARFKETGIKPQLYLEQVERYNKKGQLHGTQEQHISPAEMETGSYASSIVLTKEYENGDFIGSRTDYGDGQGLGSFQEKSRAQHGNVMFSKSSKGITVLDFDDTLATTKSGVKARIPNPDGTPKPGRKVIFMAGGAGSGKGNVISKLGFKKAGYKLVNSDISLEWLKKNHGMPENQTDYTAEQRSQLSKLSAEARKIAKRKQGKFAGNGDGVVVDGTGGSIKMMEKLVQEFKAKGYDVSMVFVETSLEVAQQRNADRKERSLREGILNKNHEQVQGNKEAFKALFGETFYEVSTDKIGLNDALPGDFKDKVDSFTNSYENRRLDAEEFARDGEGIKANGGEFDFSEFNKVLGGETAPLFNKAMKLYGKFGAENMFVLTARAPESQLAIKEFLDAQGLDIPLKNITGLGNSEASAKANWIAEKVGEGYNDFYFADDAIQNVNAVREKLDELQVKNKVQQAKIKFSMNTKRDLSWKSTDRVTFGLEGDKVTEGKIYNANFKVGDNEYVIRLVNRSLNVSNRFVKGDSVFDLEFALENQEDELWEGAGKMGLEGTGRASEVLSIVSNGVMDFIKNNNVDAIGFTSAPGFDDATSRTRLYSTLTKFWASKLGWEWTSESETHQEDGKDINSGKFIISNPNPSDLMVDEASDKTAFWYRSTEEKSMLNMFDVKGKAQQARIKFSKSGPKKMSDIIDESELDLNKILEETKGIGKNKTFSAAKARQRGKGKGRFKFFVPPSADDFAGLMYAFMGKGKQGDKHHAWFKKNLFDPFSKGMRRHKIMQQQVASDMKNLRKAIPEVRKKLNKKVPGTEYTYEDAIRIYNWTQAGLDIPGLSKADQTALVNAVESNAQLQAFAMGVNSISNTPGGMVDPGPHWTGGNIALDLKEALDGARSTHLQQWIENKNVIFNEANMNKIEAVYGPNFREALEDSLWRMENGGTRSKGGGRIVNNFTNWIHGSIGTTMFLNARSAMLQMISNVNFINWSDNNMLKAAGAFANQTQYWKDVSMIFNSPFLKQRRSGIQTDVNAAELLAQIKDSKNKLKAATAYLLQLGFTPTQIADSFAIATGGATFYRNRMKTYLKEGMTQAEAETKAFEDMMEIAEETQQSTREDKISQQQASPLGKFILAFQNTPMQYNRLIKKASLDLVNGRGDPKVNISRIVYYGGIQNLIFYGLQAALFAALFSDDEEDEITDTKKERVVNGMLDTLLRGSGIGGAVVATVKNVILKFMKESEKMDDGLYYTDPDWGNVVIEALNISPPIGIKARKIYSGLKTWEYNKDVIDHMDKTDIDNPIYDAGASVTEAVTNIPLSRLYNKVQNISESLNAEHDTWKRVAMLLGWSKWSFGIKNQDVIDAKGEAKIIKAAEEKEGNRNTFVDDQNKEKDEGKKDVTCAASTRSGGRCGNKVVGGGSHCTVHEKVKQNDTGKKTQCTHVKPDGKRCKMQTNNKSGKCYYHD